MRNLLSILVVVSLVSAAISRPAVHGAEENEEESEYENEVERADAEDASEEDEGLQESAEDEAEEEETQLSHQRQMKTNRNTHLERMNGKKGAKLAGYNQNTNSARQAAIEEESEQNENSEYNSAAEQAEQAAKYENSEPAEQYFLESEEKAHKSAENNDHNEEQPRESKTYYKPEEPQDQYSKQSNAPLQNARYRSEISANMNRDRRDIQSNESLPISKLDEEDEEAAIKRHVNKLSSDELNQFMDTLTEDKRELLKKIIDSDDNAQVNKREIKKETSAVEVNNFSGGVTQQPDPYKVEQTASVDTQQTPQSDANSVHQFKKDTQNETTTAVINNQFSLTDTLAVANLNNRVTVSQEPIKTEIKRGVSAEFEPIEAEEEFEEDVEEESQCDKHLKRKANDNNYLDSFKSLEESFPNSDSYEEDDPSSGSDLMPLVRVKRNRMKKRAAGILPDAKVGYCPCRSDNDDEDIEEGNEFDDEGFYDRSPNLIKDKKAALTDIKRSKLPEPMKTDTASIGSDTDGVITGVGDADENLMLKSARVKRTLTKESNGKPSVNHNSDRDVRSQLDVKDNAKYTNPDNNAPRYHENDAFGALPRNYEGELGRHKRIRHVQQPLSQSDSSDQQIG